MSEVYPNVKATAPLNGLFIKPSEQYKHMGYIYHESSGCRLPVYGTAHNLKESLVRLLDTDIDWTLSKEDLLQSLTEKFTFDNVDWSMLQIFNIAMKGKPLHMDTFEEYDEQNRRILLDKQTSTFALAGAFVQARY